MEGLGFERLFGGSWRNKQLTQSNISYDRNCLPRVSTHRASVEFITGQYGRENSEVLGIDHLSVLRGLTGGSATFESGEMRSLRDRRRR